MWCAIVNRHKVQYLYSLAGDWLYTYICTDLGYLKAEDISIQKIPNRASSGMGK